MSTGGDGESRLASMQRRRGGGMIPTTATSISLEDAMEPMSTEPFSRLDIKLEEQNDEELLVQEWRVEQLHRLGLPRSLAEEHADFVDWHELAKLVALGCPAELALDIVR